MPEDPVLGGLIAELERAIEEAEEGPAAAEGAPEGAPGEPPPGTPEELAALRDDLREIGIFGLLTALADVAPPADEVARELPTKLAERVRAQEPDLPADAALPALLEAYRERKGASVLRKAIENTIYDFYDLRDHALFVDDVSRVLDVWRAARGETDDVKAFVKKLAALSSDTAKFMLGLFPEQIQLIYKVSRREAERSEIDQAFDDFGPKAIWKRVFAILKSLLQHEKRLRLALTLWARLHGVAIARDQIVPLEKYLAVKDTKDLVKRALERKEARAALVAARRAHARDIAAIEDAL